MTAPAPVEPRRLALATLAAAGAALVVLVVAVLPAEYGVDPTGLGAATGFARLSETPKQDVAVTEVPLGDAPLYELRATWRLVGLPLASQEGYLGRDEGEDRVTIPFNVTNLTSVTALLEWEDTDRIDGRPTEGDTLEISVRGPRGARSQLVQATNEPGRPGNATVTLNLRSVPFPQENATTGLLIPMQEDASGVGDWTFVVRLYAAGGLDGSPEKDPGNAWRLTVTGEAYEMDVEKQAERSGDRVRITLQPGQGIEYKFVMRAGQTLEYGWSSAAVVYWDFHAEEEGKDPDEFTRYAEGRSAGETGTLVAPFAGRHGWFWRNDGADPVTLTLETRGEYEILGVPP